MLRSAAITLLLLALSSAASADIIFQYTGTPFTTIGGNWNQVFGATPTNITATVVVANPFPMDPFFVGGSVGGFSPGDLSGIESISISDGVRTITPDTALLVGYGTSINQWRLGGGLFLQQGSSDDRAIFTSNINTSGGFGPGDGSIFAQPNSLGGVDTFVALTSASGQWTATVTPEINTGGMALVSGSLLLLGYWRRRR
jgi:hypothetical protein